MAIAPEVAKRRRPFLPESVWHGQIFRFHKSTPEPWTANQGVRLIWVFILLEAIVRPALNVAGRALDLTSRQGWMLGQTSLLILVGATLAIKVAGVSPEQLGLRGGRNWTLAEKLFFAEIVPITVLVFSAMNWARVSGLWIRPDLPEMVAFFFVPQLIWGLYQELLYRAILQTELVRRWGALRGILVANVIFTFGPLHMYHFGLARANYGHLWIFAAIFGIGLYFAAVYERSRNLWMVGLLHGLGDWFLVGLSKLPKIV